MIKQRREVEVEVEVGLTLRSRLRLGMRLNALEWLLRADVVDTRLGPSRGGHLSASPPGAGQLWQPPVPGSIRVSEFDVEV